MSRGTTLATRRILGPKMVGAFLAGLGVGLVLVVPVLPASLGEAVVAFVQSGGAVVVAVVTAVTVLMVLMVLLYQHYIA